MLAPLFLVKTGSISYKSSVRGREYSSIFGTRSYSPQRAGKFEACTKGNAANGGSSVTILNFYIDLLSVGQVSKVSPRF